MKTKTKYGVSHVLGVWTAAVVAITGFGADAGYVFGCAAQWTTVVVVAHVLAYAATDITAILKGLQGSK